jgi:HD-GYP domain-containing protein (c-di-GMP phosphodiesterase class II)
VFQLFRSAVWTPVLLGGAALAWQRARAGRQGAERLAAATLETLLNAIDANDSVTGRHVRRTAAYALCLGDAVGLTAAEQRRLERVALFHDIGKIHAALFDIVHDDAELSPTERARIATHAQRGADVLEPLAAFYPELPEGVLSHHERWDGRGYPRGLRGDAIPIYARVVAIADTFDAITHSRRYHHGENFGRGVAAIVEGRATQFDPRLVDAFVTPDVLGRVRRLYEEARVGQPARPRRAARDERRADAPESSVPDVRFRWQGGGAAGGAEGESDVAAGPSTSTVADG